MILIFRSLLLSLFFFIISCGDQNTRQSHKNPDEKPVTYTLPNGDIIRGLKKHYKNGFYIGEMKNGLPHGNGAFIRDNKTTYSTANYIEGQVDGLQKIYNTINNLTTFRLIKNGKPLQVYGELDALLATGDFDKAARMRGQRVYLGIQLQDDKPYIRALRIVTNSPADLAGIKKDDRLVAINQTNLKGKDASFALRELIKLTYDKALTLTIQRQARKLQIKMIPGIIPSSHPHATSSAKSYWIKTRKQDTSSDYQHYLDTVVDNTYKAAARKRLNVILKQEKYAYDRIKQKDTTGLIHFCQRYPSSIHLADALSDYYLSIENKPDFYRHYESLVKQCPHARKFQPSYYELLSTGPGSLNIQTILKQLSEGVSSKLIATKIKTSEQQYKDFNFDEIKQLHRLGISDNLISAMIESTYTNKKASELEQRLQQLEKENQQLKAAASNSNTSIEDNEKNMPLECIKLATALKACDQSSGFLSLGCKAMAKSNFDCPLSLN